MAGCADGGARADGTIDETHATEAALKAIPKLPSRPVCTRAAPGSARCHARMVLNADGSVPLASTSPPSTGKTPSDIQSAYNLSGLTGSATVAIVDAYDDPNAESDLAVYRQQFGLPECSTANGCFKKLNQNGTQGNYPTADSGWATEIALDLDAVSAACPACQIVLVEGNSSSFSNLATAEDTAASLATVITNSYGGNESSSETTTQSHFHHDGVSIFVSSGDSGYGVEFPAASQYVTSVGGTALTKADGTTRGWAEKVWWNSAKQSGPGSGCSAYVSKPSWQADTGCSNRTVADISADADPSTGLSIYDSYGAGGWAQYGGTSLASPLAAGIYAISGKAGSDGSLSYQNTGAFYDVTSGSNTDGSCSPSYLCTAGTGYDGPTGNGTPNGVALSKL